MRLRFLLLLIVISSGAGAGIAPSFGQTWSDKQLDVWNVIEDQWKTTMEKDTTGLDKYLHEKFLGWDNQNPMPQDKSSAKKWHRYVTQNSTRLIQELYPVGIIVHGNTAVAHYFYSQASQNRKGERKTVHGQYTDILVKENGKWRFLAWRGGDNPTND